MDVNSLPNGKDHQIPERIVCAANKYGDIIITGVRHASDEMCDAYEAHSNSSNAQKLLNLWLHTYGQEGYEVKTELTDDLSEAIKFELRDFHQHKEVQGFITNKYRFVTREEAWIIAEQQNQILCRVGGDMKDGVGRLYSENLY
ncbi:hypothetical protein ACX818_001371 [Acinetobacter baumannii]